MKLEQTIYSVQNIVSLKESIHDYLRQGNFEETDETVQGGILSDVRYSWIAKGPKFEVLHTKSGTKVAAWCFGALLHDFKTCITCVVDLPSEQGKMPLLIIGLECEITGGMVCVFDVGSSRVIRAIQVDDKVTSIYIVSTGYECNLPGVLGILDGVIAVGTGKGKIFLIDLCRQICDETIANSGSEVIRDEINSCHLISVPFQNLKNLESYKEKSLNKGDHLCIQLNENSTASVHFALHGPNGEVRLRANMEEVAVSALHYCPQLAALLVGFNFGAFQLYGMLDLQLQYTSPLYEDYIPVTHFAVQEPCDDPRAFCYIWAVYSVTAIGDQGTSMAVMYALAYKTKDYLESYGSLYQEFISCSVRFQLELATLIPNSTTTDKSGARCLALRSYTRSGVSADERIALCTLLWTVWTTTGIATYLMLFDLNQWYKEQMPSVPHHNNNNRYMSCVSLTQLLAPSSKSEADVLDLRIDLTSICPFVCSQRMEEHYYPAALTWRGVYASASSLVWLNSTGSQRHLLAQLEQAGPLCLLRPSDLYNRCLTLGLTPAYTDLPAYSTSVTAEVQRKIILSVALEHQLVHWLCRCARDWANGSQAVGGCTLDMLLDWAWQRATTLKFQADKLCVPLFDHTGTCLDANALIQLNHCACQLKHLTTLFETVVNYCIIYYGEQDAEDIRYQWRTLQMISVYLEVLQWLLNVGLLPECPLPMYPRSDEAERITAPYPVDSLTRFYTERRAELHDLADSSNSSEACNLLFIDNLVTLECGGTLLSQQWRCDGGTGLYPPPSLQALLRTYLIEDIDIVNKHCLFIYVFLDLAMTLDQSRYKSIITHLIKFPAVFKLSPSIIKITQAFWQLDHGDFSTAMTQLLDPSVSGNDLKPWHHRTVLRALLLQEQYQHALLYQQVRKPLITNIQDIFIIITLLIVNDLLEEAFHFQQQNRSIYNEKEILKHFFTMSDKMDQLSSVLQLPLSPDEEQEFIKYLKTNSNEYNKILLVSYYLQRDRYAEAFEYNDMFNNNEVLQQGLIGQQDRNFRNVIIAGFKKTLPDVTQTLIDYCKKQKDTIFNNLERPLPMSVFVHQTNEQAQYKSTLIQASLQKAKETWQSSFDLNNVPFISTPKIASTNEKRNESTVIYSTIMHPESDYNAGIEVDEEATPAKRLRLSSRQSVNDTLQHRKRLSYNESPLSLLGTPIVKRKSYRAYNASSIEFTGTPQSILKTSFINKTINSPLLRETSITPEILDTEETDIESGIIPLDKSSALAIKSVNINVAVPTKERRRSPLGLSPRPPIQRTPRPAVHFEDIKRSLSRTSSTSSNDHKKLEVYIDIHREDTPMPSDSKNSSHSTEDMFYSTNTSLSESNITNSIEKVQESTETNEKSDNNESVESESTRLSLKRKLTDSNVKARKSYKNTPVKVNVAINNQDSIKLINTKSDVCEKSEIFPKLASRRSLSRQVLEQNTLVKAMQQPNIQTRLSMAKIPASKNEDKKKTVGVEVSYSKSITSFVKKSSNNITEEACDKSTMEMKNVFTTEKDPVTPEIIIKHVHNESKSKSKVRKITEILDDECNTEYSHQDKSNDDEISNDDKDPNLLDDSQNECNKTTDYHVLSFNSDINDSVAQKFYENSNQMKEQNSFLSDSFLIESKQNLNLSGIDPGDISSITHDEYKDKTISSDVLNIKDSNQCLIKESEEIEQENINKSDEEKISNQSETSDTDLEIHEKSDNDEEEEENILAQSSDEEEKISNQESEIENEFDKESSDTSLDNSSYSIDVIEIKSSSDEDNIEELKLNISDENLENKNIESERSEMNSEENSEDAIINNDNTTETSKKLDSTKSDKIITVSIEELDDNEDNNEGELNKGIIEEFSEGTRDTDRESDFPEEIQIEFDEENEIEENVEVTVEIEEYISEQELMLKDISEKINNETIITSKSNKSADCLETMSFSQHKDENIQSEDILDEDMSIKDDKLKVAEENYTPSRRITRSSSKLQNDIIENTTETEEKICSSTLRRGTRKRSSSIDEEVISKPALRTSSKKRSASVEIENEPKKPTLRTSTRKRSNSVDIEGKSDMETKNRETSKRSTRASSVVNLPVIKEEVPSIRRTRRASSVDVKNEDTVPIRRSRKHSIQSEENVKETKEEEIHKILENIPEKIEEYAATHRLTRRQKLMMEKSLELQEMKKIEAESTTLHRKTDIKESSAERDSQQFRAVSPTSSIDTLSSTAGTPTKRRRGRTSLSTTPESSPARPARRKSFTLAQQAISTPPPRARRSSRTGSQDTADVSDVSSVRSVPVEETTRTEQSHYLLRHRSLSPTALQKEATISSPKRGRKGRSSILSKKTDLSKISEELTESNTESIEGKTAAIETRSIKKKVTEEPKSSQSPENVPRDKKKRKRTSYKPKEDYFPKYALLKTRKSFKKIPTHNTAK